MGIKRIGRIKDCDARQKAIDKYVNKKVYNKGLKVPVKSLQEKGRIKTTDFDSYDEIGFFPPYMMGWSDNEINEYCYELMDEYAIRSPYDCTGKLFIMFIDWHKNPSGLVSYKIQWNIDI